MDREAWQATVHGVTKSWTQLSDQHIPNCIFPSNRARPPGLVTKNDALLHWLRILVKPDILWQGQRVEGAGMLMSKGKRSEIRKKNKLEGWQCVRYKRLYFLNLNSSRWRVWWAFQFKKSSSFENGFVIDLPKWDVKLSLNDHRHLE